MKLTTILFYIIGLLSFSECSKDDENEISEGTLLNKEIVVQLTVSAHSDVILDLDGHKLSRMIRGSHTIFTESILGTISFPKDLTINWGDGTVTSSTTHKYEKEGLYQITIKCKELKCLYIKADLIEIDLSQAVDLECLCCIDVRHNTELKKLDISRNKKLKILHCLFAPFSSVDVSNNTELMYLSFYDSYRNEGEGEGEDREWDFSKHSALRYLWLDCRSRIKSLNIKGCNELIYLRIDKFHNDILSDELANQIYNDLPQGKTWIDYYYYYNHSYCSSEVNLGGNGDISIAKKKGWNIYFIK